MDSARVLFGPKAGDAIVWDDRPTHRQDGVRIDAAQLRKIMRDTAKMIEKQFQFEARRREAAAISPMMTKAEVAAYLNESPDTVDRRRKLRDATKDEPGKARAFPPDHGSDKLLRFKREEVEAWNRQR